MQNGLDSLIFAIEIIAPLAALIAFMWNRLDKKFDAIDKRFESIDKRFDSFDKKFEEIGKDLRSINTRLSRLESQDEERFRNEIKLIIKERSDK